MNNLPKILVIDDEEDIRELLKYNLLKEGYEVEFAFDGLVGLDKIKSYQPDMVITDVLLPYKSGLEIISFTKNQNPLTPIIVISSLGKEDITVVEAFKLGATDIMAKPFNPVELKSKLKTLFAA